MSMDHRSDRNRRNDKDRVDMNSRLDRDALLRLEEIGDLHFEASAFSSALDYYQRFLEATEEIASDPGHGLRIISKSVDAALNIGDLALAEELLHRGFKLFELVSTDDPQDRQRLLAPILGRQASLFTQRSAYRDALRVAKHAFAVLAVTDDHREVANLQVTMGVCHHRLGRLGKAEEFYTDALATFRRIDDDLGMAILHSNLANLRKNACLWDQALDEQRKSIKLANAHGATHLLARLYLNEGIILRKAERHGEARASLEKSLRLARSLGDVDRQSKVNLSLGYLEMLEGNLVRAEELILEGKHLSEQAGFLREATIADEYMGDILLCRGEFDRALYNYGLGLDKTRNIGTVTDLEGELLRRCAQAYAKQGAWTKAAESAQAALAVCSSCGEDYETGFCYLTLGLALHHLDQPEESENSYREAVKIFQEQRLQRQTCEAILLYLHGVIDSAGESTLRNLRQLIDVALEDDGARSSDDLFCRLQVGLAEVLLRLELHDEVLITVSELERIAGSDHSDSLSRVTADLRRRAENGVVGGMEDFQRHVSAVSSVTDFVRGGQEPALDLMPVLRSALSRTGADRGFIARFDSDTKHVVIDCTVDLPDDLSADVARWFAGRDETGPVLMTRLDDDHNILETVPGISLSLKSCLLVPVTLKGRLLGLLGLGLGNEAADGISLKPSLEFLTTSMGFLALALADRRYVMAESRDRSIVTVQERIDCFDNIITGNKDMLEMLALVTRVAPSELTVLVQGETGTGKGLLAYSIHALSTRSDNRFMSINCAAIPEMLMESELFGHVKGSFTGAYGDKKGLLVEAEGGTVFLDEIGKLPVGMQGKLLHFLDTKVVRPVGSNVEQKVDVRIVCATKSNLKEKVDRSEFLEDLYYRLLDFPIQVPPLRQRPDDIPLLAPYFIERYIKGTDMPPPGMTPAFVDAIVRCDWPGNVRELEKTLNRAIVLANGDSMLRLEYLPPKIAGLALDRDSGAPVTPLKETLQAVESREITHALTVTGGNKAHASRLLGVSYPNLLKKIRMYGIGSS